MYAPISRFSSTSSSAKMFSFCGTYPSPLWITSSGFVPLMSSPSKVTVPPMCVVSPKTDFMTVDLPAPFGPTMVTYSSWSTSRSTSVRIWRSP